MNKFLKAIILKGAPSVGKSFYCRELMAKEPGRYKRINNDSLRESFDLGEFSADNEKIIRNTRNYLIKEFLIKGYNILIDNVNASARNTDDVIKVVSGLNIDAQVIEKPFYEDIDVLLERNSKRVGNARVPDEVVKKFYGKLGGKSFKFYKPRVEQFTKQDNFVQWKPLKQDDTLQRAIICDLDGTICDISHRSPYDASKCIDDIPNAAVVELIRLFFNNGYKIIFCSGREDKFMDLTRMWLDTNVDIKYELFMRPTNDFRKDSIIKEEIFNTSIKNKYYVRAVIDDRLQVCQLWFKLGLNLFRVGDPEAVF